MDEPVLTNHDETPTKESAQQDDKAQQKDALSADKKKSNKFCFGRPQNLAPAADPSNSQQAAIDQVLNANQPNENGALNGIATGAALTKEMSNGGENVFGEFDCSELLDKIGDFQHSEMGSLSANVQGSNGGGANAAEEAASNKEPGELVPNDQSGGTTFNVDNEQQQQQMNDNTHTFMPAQSIDNHQSIDNGAQKVATDLPLASTEQVDEAKDFNSQSNQENMDNAQGQHLLPHTSSFPPLSSSTPQHNDNQNMFDGQKDQMINNTLPQILPCTGEFQQASQKSNCEGAPQTTQFEDEYGAEFNQPKSKAESIKDAEKSVGNNEVVSGSDVKNALLRQNVGGLNDGINDVSPSLPTGEQNHILQMQDESNKVNQVLSQRLSQKEAEKQQSTEKPEEAADDGREEGEVRLSQRSASKTTELQNQDWQTYSQQLANVQQEKKQTPKGNGYIPPDSDFNKQPDLVQSSQDLRKSKQQQIQQQQQQAAHTFGGCTQQESRFGMGQNQVLGTFNPDKAQFNLMNSIAQPQMGDAGQPMAPQGQHAQQKQSFNKLPSQSNTYQQQPQMTPAAHAAFMSGMQPQPTNSLASNHSGGKQNAAYAKPQNQGMTPYYGGNNNNQAQFNQSMPQQQQQMQVQQQQQQYFGGPSGNQMPSNMPANMAHFYHRDTMIKEQLFQETIMINRTLVNTMQETSRQALTCVQMVANMIGPLIAQREKDNARLRKVLLNGIAHGSNALHADDEDEMEIQPRKKRRKRQEEAYKEAHFESNSQMSRKNDAVDVNHQESQKRNMTFQPVSKQLESSSFKPIEQQNEQDYAVLPIEKEDKVVEPPKPVEKINLNFKRKKKEEPPAYTLRPNQKPFKVPEARNDQKSSTATGGSGGAPSYEKDFAEGPLPEAEEEQVQAEQNDSEFGGFMTGFGAGKKKKVIDSSILNNATDLISKFQSDLEMENQMGHETAASGGTGNDCGIEDQIKT